MSDKNRASDWQRWAKQFRESEKCIYAVTEGPHRVACQQPAITRRTREQLPVCEEHYDTRPRERWKGFIRGA